MTTLDEHAQALRMVQAEMEDCFTSWVMAKKAVLTTEQAKVAAAIAWRRTSASVIVIAYDKNLIEKGPKGGKNAKDEEAYIADLLIKETIVDPREQANLAFMKTEIDVAEAWAEVECARSAVTVELEIFKAMVAK